MRHLNLSDIHGNWPALEAVIRAEPDHDSVAFCGDIVDYGPHPVECLHWVAEHAEHRVRGNHDNALGFDVDCRCMGSFRDYSTATRSWHRSLLSEAERRFLRKFPTVSWFNWNGRHVRMAHATPQPTRRPRGTCSSTYRRISGENGSESWTATWSFWGTPTFRACAGSGN